MASAMFQATYEAQEAITKIMTVAWGLKAGLWWLYNTASSYFSKNKGLTGEDFRKHFFQEKYIPRLNAAEITEESWSVNEQYISELLLVNAFAIFDGWVDDIIDAGLSSVIPISKIYENFSKIKQAVERGEFTIFDKAINCCEVSKLHDAFITGEARQDGYIKNLGLVFRYFKACRNCIAHGDKVFDDKAVKCYEEIKDFDKTSIGINVKEYPEIIMPVRGNPLEIKFRGVVGFYDVLRRIIRHYDAALAERKGIEFDLKQRFNKTNDTRKNRNEVFFQSVDDRKKSLNMLMAKNHICQIRSGREKDVYDFLMSVWP